MRDLLSETHTKNITTAKKKGRLIREEVADHPWKSVAKNILLWEGFRWYEGGV